MSNTYQAPPPPGQGSSGATDIVTQLQGIVRQFSTSNKEMLTLISTIAALFPQKLYGYTVATLPTPSIGMVAYVTDGDSGLAWGATVINSGAGATKYLCWFNGSHWTVSGK